MTEPGRSTPTEQRNQEMIEEEFTKILTALTDRRNVLLKYKERVGNNFLFQEYHLAELYFIVKLPKDYPNEIPTYSFEVDRVAVRKFVNENPHTDVTFTRVVLRRFFEISMARQIDIPESIIGLDPGFIEECREKENQMIELL